MALGERKGVVVGLEEEAKEQEKIEREKKEDEEETKGRDEGLSSLRVLKLVMSGPIDIDERPSVKQGDS